MSSQYSGGWKTSGQIICILWKYSSNFLHSCTRIWAVELTERWEWHYVTESLAQNRYYCHNAFQWWLLDFHQGFISYCSNLCFITICHTLKAEGKNYIYSQLVQSHCQAIGWQLGLTWPFRKPQLEAGAKSSWAMEILDAGTKWMHCALQLVTEHITMG